MNTYGLDAGYFITPVLKASVGYYYQHRDQEDVDGSGVKGRLAYNISNGLTLGANLSYDEAFDTRFTADIKYRFGSNGYGAPSKSEPAVMPAIQALSATPANRDVRVHDKVNAWWAGCTDKESAEYGDEKCVNWMIFGGGRQCWAREDGVWYWWCKKNQDR